MQMNMETNSAIPEELLELLACPDCGGDLKDLEKDLRGTGAGDGSNGGELHCSGCGGHFEIRSGIPILYPKDFDGAHIEEERKLGELMKRPGTSGAALFSENQWRESKTEFWTYVQDAIGAGPLRTVIYIGCGIDTRFLRLQELGYTVVAFDLTFHLLDTLRNEHGSRHNVAGAVQSLPFKRESFDVLCCIDLIHHEFRDIPRILDSFKSILKTGGLLFLEDINAWGLYQFPKSIFLPKRLHGALRSFYHRLKRSSHRPADYEFPTSVWRTRKILAELGFEDITVVPQRAYPNVSPLGYKLYTVLARSEHVRRYHNFHYMISARKER